MAKKNRGPRPPVVNVTSSTTVEVTGGISSSEFQKLLAAQEASLGELSSIKKLLELSKDIKKAEAASSSVEASRDMYRGETKTVGGSSASPVMDHDRISAKLLDIAKEQLKGSRKYWKTQEEFQKEWDEEAKNIADMTKGMETFRTFGEKMQDKKEGLKEKFGLDNGGLKKTVLSAMNVGGVFNKTLARDEFVKKQKALGSTASTKELKADFEGARKATRAIQKNEKKIQDLKDLTGADEDELRVHHSHLFESRQTHTEELSKYDRSTRKFSPDKKNAQMAGLLPQQQVPRPVSAQAAVNPIEQTPTAQKAAMVNPIEQTPTAQKAAMVSPMAPLAEKAAMVSPMAPLAEKAAMVSSVAGKPMSNLVPTPSVPELGKTPTSTAAEAVQNLETAEEGKKIAEEELKYIKIIAENSGGAKAAKAAATKKPEEKQPEGGGLLDSLFGMLSSGLMQAFKALLNPGAILKALGKVFAIGMIVGALFEGIMDGFDEFMKTGDIGKALIAGLAGIIDFLTFGLFDKEKIKEVIGDMGKWLNDHLIQPYVKWITFLKDSFIGLFENIGIPEIKFKIPVINKEVSIGPFYPFKSDAKPQGAAPTAPAPTTANQVESKSAENAGAKETPSTSNKTNVVNAPVTNNNNTAQVQIRPPIRNQDSTQNRYMASKYAG